jgi:hypothetical protein
MSNPINHLSAAREPVARRTRRPRVHRRVGRLGGR